MTTSSSESLPSPTSMLEVIGVGLVLVDEAGDVTIQNSIAEQLLARRINERTLLEHFVDLARTPPSEGSSLIDSTDDQQKVETYDADGKRSVVGFRIGRSSRLGTIFTLRDISEMEQARADQRQLERLSQVGKACAMVAHEIGNPLAAIKATIQSIEPEAAKAGLQDPISVVYFEIDRLDKILGQLLGFVRHRAPRRTKTDIRSVVRKAQSAVASRLEKVTFRATYAGPLFSAHVDSDQIEQVLINLFLNAADAQPDGGSLSVSVENDGEHLLIRVEDEGPGIAPDLRQQVFESFYTTKATGTGLGLSICYRIISEHGGTISVDNRRTKGACILITIPNKMI